MLFDIFNKKRLAEREAKIRELEGTLEEKGVSFIRGGDDTTLTTTNPLYLNLDRRAADNNSIIMACSLWAMRNIRSASAIVEEDTPDGWKRVPKHPVSDVIRRPQGKIRREDRTRMTGNRMAGCLVHGLLLDGNFYQHKVRNRAEQVIGLEYLPFHAVDVIPRTDLAGVVNYYRVNLENGKSVNLAPKDVVHHQIGIDPYNTCRGISPLKSLMRQVLTDNEIAVYAHSVIKMPSPGIMVSPQMGRESWASLSVDEAQDLAKDIQQTTTREKAGGTIVPTVPIKVDRLRLNPDEMAIDKINQLPEERISAVFGIPAIVAGLGAGLDRATYANMAEAREAAAEEFLLPMWSDMADTYTNDLLEDFGDIEKYRVSYDVSDVRALAEDKNATHERARGDFQANLINRAEARTRIGEKPLPGDDKTWNYQFSGGGVVPPMLPTGPKKTQRVRKESEGR